MAKVKVTLSFDETILDYLRFESDRTGVTMSGLISFLLDQRRQAQDIPALVKGMQSIMDNISIHDDSGNK